MLAHLRVRNLGVLEDAAIGVGPGLTVITGETGAGKTLLLDALRLIAGGKAKTGSVGPFGDEAVSEGLFDSAEGEVGITRRVPREGKSRAYLDGNLVAANVLEGRLGPMLEIVGQHDQLLLRRASAVLALVDGALDTDGLAVKEAYDRAWARHRTALDDQRRLGGDRMALERELDLVRYQADEIASSGLAAGDDVRIEALASRLRNSETIRESLSAALDELDTVSEAGGSLIARLRRLAETDASIHDQVSVAETMVDQSGELARALRDIADSIEDDPKALARLEDQLNLLGDLRRKYGRTLGEVLEFGAEAAERARELAGLLAKAESIERVVEESRSELTMLGGELTRARMASARIIADQAKEHLRDMGLSGASLDLTSEPTEPGPSGVDRFELRFASDDRLDAGPIHEVASGGELSRLILALRLATRSEDVDTLVFDEVDAGVGGATALAMGRKLFELSRATQVLCVTHLPQVAAHADSHFLIEREGATATVRKLDDEERVADLTRMLAGLPDSVRGREAATELLESARA